MFVLFIIPVVAGGKISFDDIDKKIIFYTYDFQFNRVAEDGVIEI